MGVNDIKLYKERMTDEVVFEIENEIRRQYGSWSSYSKVVGINKFNIKNQLMGRVRKINMFLKPLGYELTIIRRNKRL